MLSQAAGGLEAALGAKVRVPTIEGAVDMISRRARRAGNGCACVARIASVAAVGVAISTSDSSGQSASADGQRARLVRKLAATSHFNPRQQMKG
jgi:hypothetical protein